MELINAITKKASSVSIISTRFLIAIIVTFYSLTFIQPIHAMADDLEEKADSIYELFGLSYFVICDRTGWTLPTLKIWQEDFTEDPDLKIYMTYKVLENGRKIVFLFQNARCTAIYCDSAGRITNALREDYDRNLGELVNGLSCRMT
jgi:hypothetical protein